MFYIKCFVPIICILVILNALPIDDENHELLDGNDSQETGTEVIWIFRQISTWNRFVKVLLSRKISSMSLLFAQKDKNQTKKENVEMFGGLKVIDNFEYR